MFPGTVHPHTTSLGEHVKATDYIPERKRELKKSVNDMQEIFYFRLFDAI